MLRLFQFFFGPLVSIYKVFPLARKLFDFSYMLFKKKGGWETFAAQCKIFARVLLIQLLPSRTKRCKIKQWCSGRADG